MRSSNRSFCSRWAFLLVQLLLYLCTSTADLLVAENSLRPWPSGHGEQPPPIGSLVRVNSSGVRQVIVSGLVDPVWVVGSSDGMEDAYVGLFHLGEIVRISLHTGNITTVAKGLSCPEGVAVQGSVLYAVENPVGDECQAAFPLKKGAQLTRINLNTGLQTKVAGLRSSTGGGEGGPHGLAIKGNSAFVCDCAADHASLMRVDLSSGSKTIITNLTSPSGCAVGGNFAYVVEQGGNDGQLLRVSLKDVAGEPVGSKRVLLNKLAGPMGVAVDVYSGFIYVGERHKNQIRSVKISDGKDAVFAAGLKSPIGIAALAHYPLKT